MSNVLLVALIFLFIFREVNNRKKSSYLIEIIDMKNMRLKDCDRVIDELLKTNPFPEQSIIVCADNTLVSGVILPEGAKILVLPSVKYTRIHNCTFIHKIDNGVSGADGKQSDIEPDTGFLGRIMLPNGKTVLEQVSNGLLQISNEENK